ncbi:MAG: hypothetical protein JWO94_2504 [Verrucomicrobiaceae bacterium]|nr:hypothetical protein [Verrucomicrobiaceae bacterium]
MSVKIQFTSAVATGIVLAKVGNPQRDEPLQTSREVFKIDDEDKEALTALFLKPFKNLAAHRFFHHSSLDQHEMNNCAAAIFSSPNGLLEKGCDIAKRLYSKSNHPNIKSGDLCVALIDDIEVNNEMVQGLCILKSETIVPFLSISTQDGDLHLSTEQGINPEKIDKGCLILNFWSKKGYYVLTFDRSGAESRFWMREFLGLQAIPDSAFLTNTYADMAVKFVEQSQPESDDAPPWDTCAAAQTAISFFDEREHFDLEEFEEKVLKTPDAVSRFAEHRSRVEEEQGQPLESSFEISPKDLKKVKKRIGAVMKLDTGVEVHVKSTFASSNVIERGYDDGKGMKFVKVYYHQDLANPES